MPVDEVLTDVGVILSREHFSMPFMQGEIPGQSPDQEDTGGDLFGTQFLNPPIPANVAINAVKKSGDLAAVLHAVAEGCAGSSYDVVPRAGLGAPQGFRLEDPSTWTPDVRRQHDAMTTLVQAGFQGNGATSLRQGFYEQEHDRAMLGWSGIVVFRAPVKDRVDGMPPPPKAFGRFQACNAKFTKCSVSQTMVPIPITLVDGTILWVEEARQFRRLAFESHGRVTWYKQYGDWRSMDARTGKYSTGNRRLPALKPGLPAAYQIGVLPDNAVPALEVMHWSTSFPGVDPYGVSAWHSELQSVSISAEASALLYDFLKAGIHGVVLAAGSRPFDDVSVENATKSIDQLGRGRKGMGALITLGLIPGDSKMPNSSPAGLFGGAETSADRGRVIFHELSTKMPAEVMDGSIRTSAGISFAHAERIPAIILGKSENYNFATASAAWETANRLRFSPHIDSRNSFMARVTVEMGSTFWTVQCKPSNWTEDEPLAGMASVMGQNAGLRINDAVRMLSISAEIPFTKFDGWWGELPMPILTAVLKHPDPPALLRLLGMDEAADLWKPSDPKDIVGAIGNQVGKIVEAESEAEPPGVTNG